MARTATPSPWPLDSSAGTKVLLLLRHAKSDWDTAAADHERPLNARGWVDAAAVGNWLAEHTLAPDVVVCSSATRTRETWDRAVAGGASATEVRYLDEIYLAEADTLVGVVRGLPEAVRTALLIGHSPGVPDLVGTLGSRVEVTDAWTRLDQGYPTAGLAVLTLPAPWREADRSRATLVTFEVPRGSARK